MNKSFVRQLLQRVEKHEVYMGNWMEVKNGSFVYFEDFLSEPEKYICGTNVCGAGHACLVDIEETKRVVDLMLLDDWASLKEIGWDDVAQRLMGISDDDASNLFYSLWPDEYLEMGDKAGLIAILKRGLEEGSFEFVREGRY